MRKRPIRPAGINLVLAAGAFAGLLPPQEKAERSEPGPNAPPARVLEWTSAQGRPYWYRLPKKVDPKSPPNLLLMLHGTGLDHRWSFLNYPIAGGDFRKGDIVVSPDGLTPGQGGTFNFLQGKTDGEQIVGIIQSFKRTFPIGNVYLYGHSQGAFFCYWFAGEYPETIQGIVAHAGNVLDVKFPKYAKDHVAIGILHGRKDAVVPVECASRTERIYREEGYRKLKLRVVERLSEESGHWPLPQEVGEMLDWLDQVSASTPAAALAAALHQFAKESCDLAVIADSVQMAGRLLKNYRGADRTAIEEKISALKGFLGDAAGRHATALTGNTETPASPMAAGRFEYGEWAVRFRIAHRGLRTVSSWKDSAKNAFKQAESHEKILQAAMKNLAAEKKAAFRDATKALEEAFLGWSYEELVARMQSFAQGSGELAAEVDVERFRKLVADRREAESSGRKTAEEVDRALAASFKERHEDWLSAEED